MLALPVHLAAPASRYIIVAFTVQYLGSAWDKATSRRLLERAVSFVISQ